MPPPQPHPFPDLAKLELTTSESGLMWVELEAGKGDDEAADGQRVNVHYSGYLEDGTLFDSSKQRDTPFAFTIGAGEVIAGWDEGVTGMKPGSKRILVVPSGLGYGRAGKPPTIPGGATLVFVVERLE